MKRVSDTADDTKVLKSIKMDDTQESSPRMRGSPNQCVLLLQVEWIIPAHAGLTLLILS